MKLECPREQDVMDAINTARWPDRCDDELRRHVVGCEVCGDLVEILGPVAAERDAAWDGARVPPASVVWWRAQLRARHEALRAAARPLTAVYAIALVFFGGLLGGAFVAMLPRLRGWASAIAAVQLPAAADLGARIAPLASSTVVLLAFATWLLLAPLAIWLVFREDS